MRLSAVSECCMRSRRFRYFQDRATKCSTEVKRRTSATWPGLFIGSQRGLLKEHYVQRSDSILAGIGNAGLLPSRDVRTASYYSDRYSNRRITISGYREGEQSWTQTLRV